MLPFIKILFIASCLLFLPATLSASNGGGYILTLDKKKIPGEIKDIIYSDWYCEVTFINNMGTPYKLNPFLIAGFYFEQENEGYNYESKFHKGRWLFLRIIVKGDRLNLYSSHSEKKNVVQFLWGDKIVDKSIKEFWLEWPGKVPILVTPSRFKRMLKSKFSKYPSLAKKIGTSGYRFKDLVKIVEEYNQHFRERGTKT